MKPALLAVVELDGWSGFIAIRGERKMTPVLYISNINSYDTNPAAYV
jgi:hypothetical protein